MIDLHIHTTMSDGDFEASLIIEHFQKNGGGMLAITDHDIINKNCNNSFVEDDLFAVKGIELTADFSGGMHILGYGIEDSVVLETQLKRNRTVYVKAMMKLIKLIKQETGIVLNDIDINKITRHELADILVSEKICSNSEEVYNSVLSYEANKIRKPSVLSPEAAIKGIHDAKGIAILAHPHKNNNISLDTINMLIEMGIDGIECFHPSHTKKEIKEMLEICDENNLLISGGSDFHRGELINIGMNIDYDKLTIIKELERRLL